MVIGIWQSLIPCAVLILLLTFAMICNKFLSAGRVSTFFGGFAVIYWPKLLIPLQYYILPKFQGGKISGSIVVILVSSHPDVVSYFW